MGGLQERPDVHQYECQLERPPAGVIAIIRNRAWRARLLALRTLSPAAPACVLRGEGVMHTLLDHRDVHQAEGLKGLVIRFEEIDTCLNPRKAGPAIGKVLRAPGA